MPSNFGANSYFQGPVTNSLGLYGSVQMIQISCGNVAAANAGTTELAHFTLPAAYGVLLDVAAAVDASGATAGGTVTVYGATTAGSQIKSLSAPIAVAASIAVPTVTSAVVTGKFNNAFNSIVANNAVEEVVQATPYLRGQVFSVRANTVSGATFTNLVVTLLVCISDKPFS